MSSTNKWKRGVLAIASKYASPFDGHVSLDHHVSRGHPQLIIEIGGAVRTLGISSSPASHTAALFGVERDVRKIIREMTDGPR